MLQATAARHRGMHELSQHARHTHGTLAVVAAHEHLPNRVGYVQRRVQVRGTRMSLRLRQQDCVRGPCQLRKVSCHG